MRRAATTLSADPARAPAARAGAALPRHGEGHEEEVDVGPEQESPEDGDNIKHFNLFPETV